MFQWSVINRFKIKYVIFRHEELLLKTVALRGNASFKFHKSLADCEILFEVSLLLPLELSVFLRILEPCACAVSTVQCTQNAMVLRRHHNLEYFCPISVKPR
jgi:hypothetical protein